MADGKMDPKDFRAHWETLCSRFRREVDDQEALDYLEFVEDRLTEQQIVEAFRALWATREFFPRPMDFLLAAHAGVVVQLRRAALAWHAKIDSGAWVELAGGQDSLAMAVCRALGGIDAVYTLLEAGPGIVRREVEATMADVLTEDARVEPGVLPLGPDPVRLPWRYGAILGPRRVGELARAQMAQLASGDRS